MHEEQLDAASDFNVLTRGMSWGVGFGLASSGIKEFGEAKGTGGTRKLKKAWEGSRCNAEGNVGWV